MCLNESLVLAAGPEEPTPRRLVLLLQVVVGGQPRASPGQPAARPAPPAPEHLGEFGEHLEERDREETWWYTAAHRTPHTGTDER